MPITIYAIDEEFAASSGANVNPIPGRSIFDYPPNSTANLTITSNMSDENPFQFDVGEIYDLAWTGHGGGTMEDATIIRSDFLAPGQGAIVFEGINSNTGELYQLVWTPNFNLEQWFYDNGGASNPPGFWTDDQNTADYGHICFAAGTLIATPQGLRPVETLRPGHRVTTLDNGAESICWMGKKTVLGVGTAAPVVIDPGVLDNDRTLTVSPQHRIMLSGLVSEIHFGQSEVWVPAKSLVNGSSIRFENRREVDYHHILLPRHEVLLAEGQPTESLYLGDVAQNVLTGPEVREVAQFFPDLAQPKGAPGMQSARMMLKSFEARLLAQLMGLHPSTMSQSVPRPMARTA